MITYQNGDPIGFVAFTDLCDTIDIRGKKPREDFLHELECNGIDIAVVRGKILVFSDGWHAYLRRQAALYASGQTISKLAERLNAAPAEGSQA